MANWKKVIVSGSQAQLSQLSVDTDVNITGSLNASGSVYLQGLTSATQGTVVGYDVATGKLYYQETGSVVATSASFAFTASYAQTADNFYISNTLNVGSGNTVSGPYSAVIGVNNCSTGQFATIAGGSQNYASGNKSFIGGGANNTASGYRSFIGTGCNNTASNYDSFVGGGEGNTASGYSTFVGGGRNNRAQGYTSAVLGGQNNCATGNSSTVSGGYVNRATGNCSTVSNGYLNCARGNYSTVINGCYNYACGYQDTILNGAYNCTSNSGIYDCYNTILGGSNNQADGGYSTVINGYNNLSNGWISLVGGQNNCATRYVAVSLSGHYNCATNTYATVLNGRGNTADGRMSFIGNGCSNTANACLSTILNGCCNVANGYNSFIGSGWCNCVNGTSAAIVNGECNWVDGFASTISGGYGNCITDNRSNISAGAFNTVSSYDSFIGAGYSNTVSNAYAFVGAGTYNSNSAYAGVIVGGYQNSISGNYSFIGAGQYNCVNNQRSVIVGGRNNCVFTDCAAIVGGCQNTIDTAGDYSFIGGGVNNVVSAACSAILGGQNNFISASAHDTFIIGSNLTGTQQNTTYVENFNVSGSIFAPNLTQGTQAHFVAFDSASGQFTFESTASLTASTASYVGVLHQDVILSGSLYLSHSSAVYTDFLYSAPGETQTANSIQLNPIQATSQDLRIINNSQATGSLNEGNVVVRANYGNIQLDAANGVYASGSMTVENVLTASQVWANSNGQGTNFQVGDDAWIGDVNIANTIQIRGIESTSSAYIKFGDGTNSPIVGANAETGVFEVTGSLNVSGSIFAGLTVQSASYLVGYDPTTKELHYTGTGSVVSLTASYANEAGKVTNALSQGTGIDTFSYDGSSTQTVAVSGAVDLSTNTITKWTGDAFANSSITDDNVSGVVINNPYGVLVQQGGIFVSGASTFHDNTVFQGNVTVQGTASFQNVDNLAVKDQFILLNSGSTTFQDSGIIINTGNSANSGSALFLETSATTSGTDALNGRFAVASGVLPDATSATAAEYVNTTVTNAGDPNVLNLVPQWGGTLNGQGNTYVDSVTGDIYIWS